MRLQICMSLSNCIHLIESVSPKGSSMLLRQGLCDGTDKLGFKKIIICMKSCIGLANVSEAGQMFIFDNQQVIS